MKKCVINNYGHEKLFNYNYNYNLFTNVNYNYFTKVINYLHFNTILVHVTSELTKDNEQL
jgi:hypothetical protein